MAGNSQFAYGYFGRPLIPGAALAKQPELARKINLLCDVLEGLAGVAGLRVTKPDAAPRAWQISAEFANSDGTVSGGVPDGFVEVEDAVVDIEWDASSHSLRVKRATILAKDVGEWEELIQFQEFDA